MTRPGISDHEIITLSANESSRNDAFMLLMQKYQSRLYWHIRKMVLSHDDADDILQESFVKIWQNLPAFRGDSSLYTWLFRIVTNETLSFIQKKKRKPTSSIEEHEIPETLTNDPLFDGTEIEARLYESVNRLPEKQRLIFNMKYFDEMKYEEISEVLNTSVGALKASFHHAVKKIEAYLKNEMT